MAAKGEIQPDLSRKIYFICCHIFLGEQDGGQPLPCSPVNSNAKFLWRFPVAKDDNPRSKSKKNKKDSNIRWIVTIFFVAMIISSAISFSSSLVLEDAGIVGAFIVLLLIVLLGILFDIIGVAVMSAEEKPFHSMAAKKVPGAAEALKLLRNADKVSSFCNDVVGDICGVVSGSASAVIAVKALSSLTSETVGQLIMSALVAGLTIGGKACGKGIAMKQATLVVSMVSKPIYYIKSLFRHKPRR